MLVARRPSGETVAWPVIETVQVDGILRELVVPAPDRRCAPTRPRDLGLRIAEAIDLAGVMAVELFDTGDGLLINELACRPHNSGHWTIEGAATSQFANHLRAVLDWPLGDTTPLAPAVVTVNVLGRGDGFDPADGMTDALAVPAVACTCTARVARPGRKLGHVTALGDDADEVRERARAAAAALGEPLEGSRDRSRRCRHGVATPTGTSSPRASRCSTASASSARCTWCPRIAVRTTMLEYGRSAAERGLQVIVACAGGAAHLPGMLAAATTLPVIGIPRALRTLDGLDSLLSIAQMPKGVPVATVAIDGAANAGLLAVRILAVADEHWPRRCSTTSRRSQADSAAADERLQDRL